jgi:hypothetical protein
MIEPLDGFTILFILPQKYNLLSFKNTTAFWPSADVKPMSNDLVHAVPWQRMFALYKMPVLHAECKIMHSCILFYNSQNCLECLPFLSKNRKRRVGMGA